MCLRAIHGEIKDLEEDIEKQKRLREKKASGKVKPVQEERKEGKPVDVQAELERIMEKTKTFLDVDKVSDSELKSMERRLSKLNEYKDI